MIRRSSILARGLLAAFVPLLLAAAAPALAQTPAVVGPVSPSQTISAAHPAVPVPVDIHRDGTTALLGFSVHVQLSSEFAALNTNTDVAIGGFMTDGGRGTNLQVVDNGGGNYTIDGVTLGTDCGPTAQSGTLFTLTLHSTAPGGTGTVTVQSVTLRDCSNQTVPSSAGSAASVAIDNTGPTVGVIAPNGAEAWVYQTSHAITWSASDAAGVASVDLEYSTNGGSSWTTIATGEANDGSYAWAVPNAPSANALVRVTAHDALGNSASDASDAAFTILSNTAPVLASIPDQAAAEGTPLTLTASATDGESPPQTLRYSLAAGPTGAQIDPSTGAFSWTPGETDGGTTPTVSVRVTDDGVPALFDEKSFSVHVDEVNVAPTLNGVPASATIPELVAYTFTATASDPDLPAQALTFSLIGAPTGATIGSTSGVFAWTPAEDQGPGVYPFQVRVSDGPTNTDANITLTVTDTNSPPVLTGVPASPVTIPEMAAYSFDANATDSDLPAQTLTFSLVGEPAGATIDGTTGVFHWTPTETQGPGDYSFTVRVSDGEVNTDAPLTIHVDEVNVAPALAGVPTGTVTIPELVAYGFTATATDPDVPVQAPSFSLIGAPTGATMGGSSGVFGWTPTEAQGPGDYSFTVRVSDGVASTDASVSIHVDEVSIAAITDLTASLVRSGNDQDGTMKVLLNWTATPGGTTVEVYRARFGAYPEYDDATGAPPAAPGYPVTSPWEAVSGVTAPGQPDEVNGPGGRDYWYYVAFVHGAGGNVSGPSNQPATPNYLLGDVTNGGSPGTGDNVVGTGDISLLGGNYGLTGSAVTAVNYLDVGPTSDHSVNGLPLTDNAINFEDLVIFALNYGTGPAPQLVASARGGTAPAGAMAADRLVVAAPSHVGGGEEFTVPLSLEGTGRVQALSAALDWNHATVEPIGVVAGEWATRLDGVVLSPKPGAADVALLGARADGFAGRGVVAVVRFRALAAGDPQVTVARASARDGANRDVSLASEATRSQTLPTVTMLSPVFPNPFRGSTTIAWSLAQAGRVTISIFGVDGRRVRTLAGGLWQPGEYRLTWNGRDEDGQSVAAGIYFVQLAAPGLQTTRRIAYLR